LEAKRGIGNGRRDIDNGFKEAVVKQVTCQLMGNKKDQQNLRKGDRSWCRKIPN